MIHSIPAEIPHPHPNNPHSLTATIRIRSFLPRGLLDAYPPKPPEHIMPFCVGRHLTTLNDLGTMDEDGYVRITERLKEMIIRGGENIYPREIGDFIFTHPKVAEVAVIGVPDDFFGEEVMTTHRTKRH